MNDYVYIIFGSYWNFNSSPNITALNYKTGEITVFNLSDNMSIYGHRASHYADSIYVFGGGLSINSLLSENTATNAFYRLKFTDNDRPSPNCSTGTFLNKTCQPCPAGTYYNSINCSGCPAGTFSNKIALKSVLQCLPCAYSHYSPVAGATYCVECSSNVYCPIGSSYVRDDFSIEAYKSIQPAAYSGNLKFISNLITNL